MFIVMIRKCPKPQRQDLSLTGLATMDEKSETFIVDVDETPPTP